MGAGVSASDSSLRGVRDHGQKRCHPAKRISGSGWRFQVRIHHHIAAPRFVAMAVYNAQSLLVIQNSRPCDKLTGRLEVLGSNLNATLDLGQTKLALRSVAKELVAPASYFDLLKIWDYDLGSHRNSSQRRVSVLDDHDPEML
jgi:hypothetical protein